MTNVLQSIPHTELQIIVLIIIIRINTEFTAFCSELHQFSACEESEYSDLNTKDKKAVTISLHRCTYAAVLAVSPVFNLDTNTSFLLHHGAVEAISRSNR